MKHWNRKYINKSFIFSLFILFISQLCLSSAIAAPLVNGQSISISEPTGGTEAQYHIDVAPGATSLQLDISGGTGDADLYVRFGDMPTTSTYDCRPWKNGNEETCQFDNPSEGRWYVMVRAYNPYSGVTLSAASDGGASPGTPTALSPSGTISTNQPTFTWTAVSGSSLYAVYAKDATGELQVWNVVSANHAGCESGTGTCSYSHSTAVFAEGSGGFWKVMTVDNGYGPESNTLNFTVNTEQSSDNELSSDGQPIAISQSTEDAKDHFFVDVVPEASSLIVQISNGTGDADLYVRFGAKPTLSTYDCRPWLNGNEETCQFDNPQEGRWYIMIVAYNAYSGVSLSAKVETGNSSCDMSIDSDNDRLPDCYETNTGHFVSMMDTGTDPNNVDTDGDAIPDGDEVLGTQDGLDLPGMGVSPVHKDVLVEYDWADDELQTGSNTSIGSFCNGFHSHRPGQSDLALITTAFMNAPVSNPDGDTGINIIHDYGQGGIFTGGNMVESNGILEDGVVDADLDGYFGLSDVDFTHIKSDNFASNRNQYFHYVLMMHQYDGSDNFSSGQGELPGDDFIVATACFGFADNRIANTIMHELGHNLGLKHGGFEHQNHKPNYNSIMNYRYQLSGGTDTEASCNSLPSGGLDYSRGDRLSLNENNLDEVSGVCGDVPIDFNGDGQFLNGVQFNFPGTNNASTVLLDHSDWTNLTFGGLSHADGASFTEVVRCESGL